MGIILIPIINSLSCLLEPLKYMRLNQFTLFKKDVGIKRGDMFYQEYPRKSPLDTPLTRESSR